MKLALLLAFLSVHPVWSQTSSLSEKMIGTWKFVRGLRVVANDTIVQLPDPRYEEVTDVSRPYTEIVFVNDSVYEAGIFYFQSPYTMFPGKWSIDSYNTIQLTPRFPDKNTMTEFNGFYIQMLNDTLILSDKGSGYYFVRK